jgi:hypothetical protein
MVSDRIEETDNEILNSPSRMATSTYSDDFQKIYNGPSIANSKLEQPSDQLPNLFVSSVSTGAAANEGERGAPQNEQVQRPKQLDETLLPARLGNGNPVKGMLNVLQAGAPRDPVFGSDSNAAPKKTNEKQPAEPLPKATTQAFNDLIEKLRDDDFSVRESASKQLKAFNQAVPQMEKKVEELRAQDQKTGDDLDQIHQLNKILSAHKPTRLARLAEQGWMKQDGNGRIKSVYNPGSTDSVMDLEYKKDGGLSSLKFTNRDGEEIQFRPTKDGGLERVHDSKVRETYSGKNLSLSFDRFGPVVRDGQKIVGGAFLDDQFGKHPTLESTLRKQGLLNNAGRM